MGYSALNSLQEQPLGDNPISASKLRHDLLTPVNHLVGYSEILLDDWSGNEPLTNRVQAIHSAAKELVTLIQLALPASEESAESGIEKLRLLLPGPLDTIVQLIAAIRAEADDEAQKSGGADLEKLLIAVQAMRGILENPGTLATGGAAAAEMVAPEPAASPVSERAAEPAASYNGRVLVVEDNDLSRDLLSRRLERDGYTVTEAENGLKALELLAHESFDVMLLDVIMPEINGVEVLRRLQSSACLQDLPVIMLSAMDEVQQAVQCIELGAQDYLTKPFNPVLLRARMNACMEKQRLRAEERRVSERLRTALREVEEQRQLAESLLRNILPARISEELRRSGHVNPKYFDDVTIVFTDFVGFSISTESMAADEMVEMLHEYFTAFDRVVKAYGMEKLKTIGDSYMFLGGMPPRTSSHAVDAVLACLELLHIVEGFRKRFPDAWQVRVGMHTGPVIAGVVGVDKFAFDVWGETVNYSSRMESSGEPGRINLSERAYSRVKDFFECEPRGKIMTKEQRAVDMYFVKGVHPKLMRDLSATPPPLFLRRYLTYFERDPPAFPSHLGAAS